MVATPFVLRAAGPLARWVENRFPGPAPVAKGDRDRALDDHVIVVGFGVNGRNVTRALAALEVPHVVIDLNVAAVHEVTAGGGRGVYGDATRDAVLTAAGVSRARAVIAALPDAAATRQVVAVARRLSPEVSILARTRYVREVEPLEALGADQVIPEEFETSIELTARVLRLYGASEEMVRREGQALRATHYGALRRIEPADDVPTMEALRMAADVGRVEVQAGCPADGCSLRRLGVRQPPVPPWSPSIATAPCNRTRHPTSSCRRATCWWSMAPASNSLPSASSCRQHDTTASDHATLRTAQVPPTRVPNKGATYRISTRVPRTALTLYCERRLSVSGRGLPDN